MAKRDIIVIGASAGGVQTLQTLVSGLPSNFAAALFVVLHIPPYGQTLLPKILNRAGKVPAKLAENDEYFSNGQIYVAPPDRHLLLKPGKMLLEAGPRENFHRPAIDPLFRSAARHYRNRVIGIVLTGLLDDGSSGLKEINSYDGVTVVQDPHDALFSSMPINALRGNTVNHILPVNEIPELLTDLIEEDVPEIQEVALPGVQREAGNPSVYSCPDCGGVLWEQNDRHLIRFRCRVGHTYGSESLSARQSEDVEHALWEALTSLEESASFSRRLAVRAWQRGEQLIAERYEEKMKKAEENAAVIRDVLLKETVEQPEPEGQEAETSESSLP